MKKQTELFYMLTVISIFCLGQIPGSIDAAISKIAIEFHLSSTSGLYVTTIASLTSVATGIIVGLIAGKKIGIKPLLIIVSSLEMIGAIAPFFISDFKLILFFRALFGIGFGAMQSLENTVATILIGRDNRAKVIGLGTFFGFGCNCLLQLLGGFLADIGWNYVFLNHLLLLLPFAFIILKCPDINDKKTTNKISSAKSSMSSTTYIMWGIMFLVGVFIAPLLIGASFLSEPINNSAFVAGVVCVCFSVGCMAGGLIFPKASRIIGDKALSVFLVTIAVGSVGCGLSRSIIILCIMIFIAGVGFTTTQACAMMIVGMANDISNLAMASAGMMALFNLGMFLSGLFEQMIGNLCGDSLYTPLYVGSGVLLIIAVLKFISSKRLIRNHPQST